MTHFSDLGLAEPVLNTLATEGYQQPTPIQAEAIPALLKGRDLLGTAQTGTGKTAAFTLPILHDLVIEQPRLEPKTCRALILAPTRELALQIADSVRTYGKKVRHRLAIVIGGVKPGGQVRAMKGGVDILIATPGRLLDHMQTGAIHLDGVKTVVMDEADQMMDLGFMPGIRKILSATPQNRQTVLLSATMPKPIRALAHDFLTDPAQVAVAAVSKPIEQIEQSVQFLDKAQKLERLVNFLSDTPFNSAIIFTRTKHGADRVATRLNKADLAAVAIHGDKSQNQRQRALNEFKTFKVNILVATDIAARGIDIDDVSHVINYEIPNIPESYVHRIGRTARAGKSGTAISFCDPSERGFLKDIERLIGYRLAVTDEKGEIEHPSKPFTEEPRGGSSANAEPKRSRNTKPRKPRPDYRGHDRRERQEEARPAQKEQVRSETVAPAEGEFRQRADRSASEKPHGRPGSKFRGHGQKRPFKADYSERKSEHQKKRHGERSGSDYMEAREGSGPRDRQRDNQDRPRNPNRSFKANSADQKPDYKNKRHGDRSGADRMETREGSGPRGRQRDNQDKPRNPNRSFKADHAGRKPDQKNKRQGDRFGSDRMDAREGSGPRDRQRDNQDKPRNPKPFAGKKPGNDNRRRDGKSFATGKRDDGNQGLRRRKPSAGGNRRRSA